MASGEKLEGILTDPMQLTYMVHRMAKEADSFKSECLDLISRAEKVASCLRSVARLESAAGPPLYTCPLRRILQELQKSLNKARILLTKCCRKGLIRRLITIISAHDFKRVNNLLDNSLADLRWFISISAVELNAADAIVGIPPITSSDPLLGFCWQQTAQLYRGSDDERKNAVVFLKGYAQENSLFVKMMVEEEVIPPLLKLLQDGPPEAQEITAQTLGLMARDKHALSQMVACGVVPVAVRLLGKAPVKTQIAMAWAVAEILDSDPSQQDVFLEESAVPTLVGLLGRWLDDLEKSKPVTNIHTLMTSMQANRAAAASSLPQEQVPNGIPKPSSNPNGHLKGGTKKPQLPFSRPPERNRNVAGKPSESSTGSTQQEPSKTDRYDADSVLKLKAEVARALWKLAKDNPRTCKSITETKSLSCFAKLMEKTSDMVQFNSVMAVLAIAAVAENNGELKRAAFRMTSLSVKAVIEQLLRLVEEGNPELQVACIKAIGCLSRVFPRNLTRVVKPLVKQLEGPDDVVAAAVIALGKFVSKENHLRSQHSKTIVDAGGAAPIVQLVFFSKGDTLFNAVILMCCVVLHSEDTEAFAKAEALPALKKFAKTNDRAQQPPLDSLLYQAINHLEIYHGGSSQHAFHHGSP